MNPSLITDARPPLGKEIKLVVLAGAIKWWWLSECDRCGLIGDTEADAFNGLCFRASSSAHLPKSFFGSARHEQYVCWRNDVRSALIDTGRYLTYAPHEAFKGVWDGAAQAVNDAAIIAADAMLVLSPPDVYTQGTDDEVKFAQKHNTPVIYTPPGTKIDDLILGLDTLPKKGNYNG